MHPNGVGPLFWYGFCPHIPGWRLKTKQKGLDHKCTPMASVLLLFWGGHILAWGHKNLFWYGFCPRISGWRLKTKQKGLDHKCTPMVSVLLLTFGGTYSRLGAQKSLLVGILPSHSRVKTKNKTKRSWSQMHPNGVGPVAFFWGTILARLGVTAPKWPPWHRVCMNVSVGNLLHWFYSLDVIWCFFSKNLMFLNNRLWHHWRLNKNSIGFKKWFNLVILCKYRVVAL